MVFPIKNLNSIDEINKDLVEDYLKYLRIRMSFLVDRFRKYPRFPGVHTGYNSITGIEFEDEFNLPYAWINGRGVTVFTRFAGLFPELGKELKAFADHTITWLEKHWKMNNNHFPFIAELDGREKPTGCPCPAGYKSYSDLYCGIGFVEYGAANHDDQRIATAKSIFSETLAALKANRFATEPDLTPVDRILENPFSVALDFANEMYKQLNDKEYLNAAAELADRLLSAYYIAEHNAFVEYVGLDGKPFLNENNDYIVDPGHAIEFCSFALEFSRLAEKAGLYADLRKRINDIVPGLLLWNFEKGWNKEHPGIYKTIEAISGKPLNSTMPWWILPECMLALVLGYEKTHKKVYLEKFIDAHNAYFSTYMNPKTDFGPFQNIDGMTGLPVDIVPACKFQDPEFHSGKNILTVIQVLERLGMAGKN